LRLSCDSYYNQKPAPSFVPTRQFRPMTDNVYPHSWILFTPGYPLTPRDQVTKMTNIGMITKKRHATRTSTDIMSNMVTQTQSSTQAEDQSENEFVPTLHQGTKDELDIKLGYLQKFSTTKHSFTNTPLASRE
jgi:hypothetical protein